MDYRIETNEGLRIIGVKLPLSKEIEKNFLEVPKFWQEVAENGTLEALFPLMDQEFSGLLSISTGFGENQKEEPAYYIGVASREAVPEGLISYELPKTSWAVFYGEGTMPDSIQELERQIITDWLPTSGYEYADGADIERYLVPDPQQAQYEVWIPVAKQNQ